MAGILVRMVKPLPNLFFRWELDPKHWKWTISIRIIITIAI